MLKTIYFDLGNVLLFFNHFKMFKQIAMLTSMSIEEVKNIFSEKKLLESCETGKISWGDVYDIFRSLATVHFSVDALKNVASDIFIPNQDIWPLVHQLKKEKMRLIVLSNTSEAHFAKACTLCPLLTAFDSRILSFEVGYLKPDIQIFKKALEAAEASLSECFYIDDVPGFLEGAKKVGLNGGLYTSVPELKNQLIAKGCDFLR